MSSKVLIVQYPSEKQNHHKHLFCKKKKKVNVPSLCNQKIINVMYWERRKKIPDAVYSYKTNKEIAKYNSRSAIEESALTMGISRCSV